MQREQLGRSVTCRLLLRSVRKRGVSLCHVCHMWLKFSAVQGHALSVATAVQR